MQRSLQTPIVRSYLLFLLVGIGSLGLDAAVYTALTRLADVHYLLARSISLVAAVIWSYFANRLWTFASDNPYFGSVLIKYLVVNAGSVLGNLGIFWLLVAITPVPDLLALLVSAGCVSVASFLINRFWTFRVNRIHTRPGQM